MSQVMAQKMKPETIAKPAGWESVSLLIGESKKKVNIEESKDRARQIPDDKII